MAHGAEGPAQAGLYVTALMVSTALLAALTSLLAVQLQSRPLWMRLAGAASAATGVAALAA
jgi:hypothetical protein